MDLRKLTLDEHKQLALLLELTRIYNMRTSIDKSKYKTKKQQQQSYEKKIMDLIDKLKDQLDGQVYEQYSKDFSGKERELYNIYYGRSKEAEEQLKK